MAEGSYKKLIVWQKSMDLTIEAYKIADKIPGVFQSGLADQIRRSALSIPSNIAEGKYRFSKNEGRQFFRIAYGSCAELETQLSLVKRLKISDQVVLQQALTLCDEILRMLNVMLRWKANS
jgi:four helix bundle protein